MSRKDNQIDIEEDIEEEQTETEQPKNSFKKNVSLDQSPVVISDSQLLNLKIDEVLRLLDELLSIAKG